jgi:hypothetical protein
MDPYKALSTAVAVRKIAPLREAPTGKVMSCALIASTNLERALDAAKEVTRGAGMPLVKMASRPANYPSRPNMVCGHSPLLPVMRAGHHQHAKVLLVPEAVERTRFMLFPLVQ